MNPENKDAFFTALREAIRGDVGADDMARALYATDASIYQLEPVAVVCPRDEEDVKTAVRLAVEHGVPIVPRGGGTSLGGQGTGNGLILDFTKYMNQILELNIEERWVRVQPGVVRDKLNAELAPHRLHFAPDPATASRAAVGGMIGNNSSGTRSIIYGKTVDHTRETKFLLTGGEVVEFAELSPLEYAAEAEADTRKGHILREVQRIVETNRQEIDKQYPKIMRRVMGYNLDEFTVTDRWNLSKLLVGSEGTLATMLEAKINLEPLPQCTGLCMAHFADIQESIRAVAAILEHRPSALEIIDCEVVDLARASRSSAHLCHWVEGDPAAILLIEFFDDDLESIERRQQAMIRSLKKNKFGYAYPLANDAAGMGEVWTVRKNGLGLLQGMKGDKKPIAFIEDACVPIEHLPEYIAQILDFCSGINIRTVLYAHVGVGEIHVRPVLDLREREDLDKMLIIADRAFELVKKYHGSFSGEHGDGRVRSPFVERFYGKRIHGAFREIKQLFDPDGLMNPNIILDPNPMDADLRMGESYTSPNIATQYKYREDGGFAAAVELCSGVGACRATLAGAMCPSYRVTGDEEHSTRGRANALRMAMTGELGPNGMTSERLFDVFDLCLSCKSCKSECPSCVDVARLKGEFLQKYHDAHGPTLRERTIAASTRGAALCSGFLAPIVNWMQGTKLFRLLLEKTIGIDRRRTLPAYASEPFPNWFAGHNGKNRGTGKKVVLFDDTYMNFHEPHVGVSAVELLESCGYDVILARAGCCQRPAISHGFLRQAKAKGEKTLRNLDKYLQQGLTVVVCEPGCCSALVDDLPELLDDEALAKRVQEGVMPIDQFLAQELADGQLDRAFTSPHKDVLIHGHCHQRALFGGAPMQEILSRVEGLNVSTIDAGCCGMAGSFGYEKEHYELSLQVGEDRLFPAIRNRPKDAAVIACGFSCRHQIAHATSVRPLHWVQTLRATAKSDSGKKTEI